MASPERDPNQRDALEDFDARELTFEGRTRRVYVSGDGPAVIVMAEMPGIHPLVSRFARRVRDAGFTVWMPHLFGDPGAAISVVRGAGTMLRACISREFRAFAADRSRSSSRRWCRSPRFLSCAGTVSTSRRTSSSR